MTGIGNRKAQHIELALDRQMQPAFNYFDEYSFDHQALPEIDRSDVDLSAPFLGYTLQAPLLISCMTGGTEEAASINRNLALGAEQCRVALGVGSQRAAIENPEAADSFRVRELAPSVPLLANLGAVQLNYGFGIRECRQAVDMIGADALVFHLNPLQEALQPEGQCDFSGLVAKMAAVAAELPVPVIVKEIGCGLSSEAAEKLKAAGLTILDTAGLGGTSWAKIEAARADDAALGDLLAGWGVPTPRSIRRLRQLGGLTIIGSGGVRNGVDAAKAIALGADLVGVAQPFLRAAVESAESVAAMIERFARELEIAMFCLGVRSVEELQRVEIRRRETTDD